MPKCLASIATAIVLSLVAAAPAAADTLLIDFEHLPGADGILGTADDVPTSTDPITSVREQYASIGLHFQQGEMFRSSYFDGNPDNHFLSSTNPIGYFTRPVFGIAITSHSVWNGILTAYDEGGNVLALDSMDRPGRDFDDLVLRIATNVPIHGFSILPEGDPGRILNLDNLELTIASVPEPSSVALLAGGIALLARRRRNHAGPA